MHHEMVITQSSVVHRHPIEVLQAFLQILLKGKSHNKLI